MIGIFWVIWRQNQVRDNLEVLFKVARGLIGEVVMLEERGASEADKGGIGQGEPHVAGQLAGPGAMRLIGEAISPLISSARFFLLAFPAQCINIY